MSRIRDIANILTASTNIATDAEVTSAMSAHNTAANGHVGRGTTANRPASPTVGDVYFDTTLATLIAYKSTGWEKVSQDPAPQIASISPTTAATTGTVVTITGSSFKSGLSVQFIGADATVYNSPVATFVGATTTTATTPALSVANEPYDIKVINNDNQSAILENALDAGGSPTWNTASGTLTTIAEQTALSSSVSATDPDGTSIVYSSSNLPAWVTLNSSTGALTGTAPDIASNTTYSFDITASDGVNTSSRSFNIIVNNIIITGGNEINTIGSYKYHIFTSNGTFATNTSKTVSICSIGGGGGGGTYTGGGGGAGELDLFSTFTLSAGNYSVNIGGAGAGAGSGVSVSVSGANGQSTTFVSPSSTTLVTSLGGGGGGSQSSGNGSAGGSGGGGAGFNNTGGAANGSNTSSGGTGSNGASFYGGGGGGGATTAGGNWVANAAGAGGQGYTLTAIDSNLTSANFSSFSGMTVVASGGGGAGGGGGSTGPSSGGAGGTGGGNGGASNDAASGTNTAGQVATSYGSGGGAGGSQGANSPGAAGKSGILIVRYAV